MHHHFLHNVCELCRLPHLKTLLLYSFVLFHLDQSSYLKVNFFNFSLFSFLLPLKILRGKTFFFLPYARNNDHPRKINSSYLFIYECHVVRTFTNLQFRCRL
ncbi:hypothetical protein AVU42_gp171 [Prochlorococcus phage P-TIM68]|uniref:Uncharacterized protein n=1 Tax=Prochlorococcus phage P-TIM68 TaxID=1542477 RepID=A0A0K0KWK9_9CAUD|nr:hypothetical protein AVU42_gp171 [Prochlorococcus phage P-TIM68]AIR93509.1 hypothetical protein [Prochlorococcus phage P-TIM68]